MAAVWVHCDAHTADWTVSLGRVCFAFYTLFPSLFFDQVNANRYRNSKHQDWLQIQLNQIEHRLVSLEHRLFGGRLSKLLSFVLSWTVPVIYTSLFSGLIAVFYNRVHFKLTNPHTTLHNITLFTLFLTFVMAIYTEPVRSRDPTRPEYPRWGHDNIIFFDADCSTCRIVKPARSKHCKYCGGCVLLYDHHCVWLNNCVGLGNFVWFYSFLVMNCVVLTWGSLLMLPLAWKNYNVGADITEELALGTVCLLFAIMVIWFTWMNSGLIKTGMTTSEQMRWEIVHDIVADGELYEYGGRYYQYLPGENVFVSVNQQDSRVVDVGKHQLNKVESIESLVNSYDLGGWWENFKERCLCTRTPFSE